MIYIRDKDWSLLQHLYWNTNDPETNRVVGVVLENIKELMQQPAQLQPKPKERNCEGI